ncbi:MAG: hypothetical protein HRT93_03900 [Piscirickettsiaceae bacterium]|nr:hypothetical protein [Piscirickettsiaceae bacterium]
MKKIIGLLSLLLVLNGAAVFAEEAMTLEQALEKKKALVLNTLRLSNETVAEFLPVYDAYQQAKFESNVKLGNIVTEFAENYNALTNVKAQELIAKWLAAKQVQLDIQKDYVAKFEKVMSKKELMRYYQLENKMQVEAEYKLGKMIPLAK